MKEIRGYDMIGWFNDTKKVVSDFRNVFRDQELKGLLFFAILIVTVGTTFYYFVEDWDVIKSFYFSVMTLTTIGFGDLHPTSDVSRLFTTVYALTGIGFVFGIINVVARQTTKTVGDRLTRHLDEKHAQERELRRHEREELRRQQILLAEKQDDIE